MDAAKGKRTPGENGGIRMGNEKFMFVGYDDTNQVTQLSKPKGGAAVASCNTCIIIAYYTKDLPMQPKGTQTGGQCAEQVQSMAAFLRDPANGGF